MSRHHSHHYHHHGSGVRLIPGTPAYFLNLLFMGGFIMFIGIIFLVIFASSPVPCFLGPAVLMVIVGILILIFGLVNWTKVKDNPPMMQPGMMPMQPGMYPQPYQQPYQQPYPPYQPPQQPVMQYQPQPPPQQPGYYQPPPQQPMYRPPPPPPQY